MSWTLSQGIVIPVLSSQAIAATISSPGGAANTTNASWIASTQELEQRCPNRTRIVVWIGRWSCLIPIWVCSWAFLNLGLQPSWWYYKFPETLLQIGSQLNLSRTSFCGSQLQLKKKKSCNSVSQHQKTLEASCIVGKLNISLLWEVLVNNSLTLDVGYI